jgi:hypothetical protein
MKVNGTILQGVGPVQLKEPHRVAPQSSADDLASLTRYRGISQDCVGRRDQPASNNHATAEKGVQNENSEA